MFVVYCIMASHVNKFLINLYIKINHLLINLFLYSFLRRYEIVFIQFVSSVDPSEKSP